MKLALYYAPTACSLVPWVNLTEAGATFETRIVNMRKAQHMSPEYLALNPKHKVPLLAIDDKLLTENVAIQQFIARTFPAAKLLPADPFQELKAIALMAWCASGVHPHLSRINSPTKFAQVGAEESVRTLAKEQLVEAFAYADGLLAGRDFFFDHFTAADSYFFWCFRRAGELQTPLADFANCQRHFARMNERESVKAVLAFEKKTLEDFAKG